MQAEPVQKFASGAGAALPCHFGEWLQGRLGADGQIALVSLVPRGAGMWARHQPAATASCRFSGGLGGIARPRLRRFLTDLGVPPQGRFLLRPRFVPGSGTGMSTAALLSVAALAGYCGPPERLVQACLAAEGASDPLMLQDPDCLLWASRQGQVLHRMPPPPRAQLLAGFWGPPLRTCAQDNLYADVSDLAEAWSQGPDLATCARLASESGRRCQALRGPFPDPTEVLARHWGALGWARSHSGSARALIYAPGTVPEGAAAALRAAGLRNVQLLETGSRRR